MTAWQIVNLIAIVCWLLNAAGIVIVWALSMPLNVGSAIGAVGAMLLSAMRCAEIVWPDLKDR